MPTFTGVQCCMKLLISIKPEIFQGFRCLTHVQMYGVIIFVISFLIRVWVDERFQPQYFLWENILFYSKQWQFSLCLLFFSQHFSLAPLEGQVSAHRLMGSALHHFLAGRFIGKETPLPPPPCSIATIGCSRLESNCCMLSGYST